MGNGFCEKKQVSDREMRKRKRERNKERKRRAWRCSLQIRRGGGDWERQKKMDRHKYRIPYCTELPTVEFVFCSV